MQAASAHAHHDHARYDRAQHWLTYARLRTRAEGLRYEEIALPPDARALRLIAVHRRTDIIAAFVQYRDGTCAPYDLLVKR